MISSFPVKPLNLKVSSFTDTSITWTWDVSTGASFYYVYVDSSNTPVKATTNSYTLNNLSYMSTHGIQVSSVTKYGLESEKTAIVSQKTLLPAPDIARFLYGETYVNGTSVNDANVTNCRLYKKGESAALLTGTITAGVLRIYVLNNVNIVAGAQYDIRALDGNPNLPATVPGMITTITAELAKITLNNVVASSGVVSGTTENNGQVRISVDGVNKTVFTASATGAYSGSISGMVAGSVVKAEAKVGTIYPSYAEKVAT
ncbi:fibronectin type III domain-containing protein [Listeria booriae]|uniref:fibronectin type III domain-containing protein n=1 Tax=Listeria booriae TaxID=1552123 RepID=UPI0035E14979